MMEQKEGQADEMIENDNGVTEAKEGTKRY
jgi:hypothetical protein